MRRRGPQALLPDPKDPTGPAARILPISDPPFETAEPGSPAPPGPWQPPPSPGRGGWTGWLAWVVILGVALVSILANRSPPSDPGHSDEDVVGLILVQLQGKYLIGAGRILPGNAATRRFSANDLWQTGFRASYRTEWRTERSETIQQIYASDPDRYDRLARYALQGLSTQGVLHYHADADCLSVTMSPRRVRWARLHWQLRKSLAKILHAVRLLKTAMTFGDWLPYVLWKLGRHTGVWIEPTERQRKHPLLFGWPLILKLYRQRALR